MSQVRDKGPIALGASACLCHLSTPSGPMRVTKKVTVQGFVLQSPNWGPHTFTVNSTHACSAPGRPLKVTHSKHHPEKRPRY